MTTFLSQDPLMMEAYTTGKDLYAMIAQSAFDNEYTDNLEFYSPGYEIEIDGQKVIAGSGKEWEVSLDDQDKITVNYYELLETPTGDKSADTIQIGEKIISDNGQLTIIDKTQNNEKITFKFSL